MMLRYIPVLALLLATPVLAQEAEAPADPAALAGDPAKGEAEFKKCKSCHSIIAPDGTAVQKGGKTGPNLYGVIGREVASSPDFKYGEGILAAKAKGAVWDQENLVVYLADPNAWVQAASGDPAAKSKMSFKLAKNGEHVAAYLATLSEEKDGD